MKVKEINFSLPIGYQDEAGNLHREGSMQLATALTEINVHNNEEAMFGTRKRDCIIFSNVVTKLGDLDTVSPEIIEELYEVDFLYLQLLYNKLNRDNDETIETMCPHCGNSDKIYLPDLYKNLHQYFKESANQ